MRQIHLFIAWMAWLLLPMMPMHAHDAFSNATILLIRHADKPDTGNGLSQAGEKRAQDYVDYFTHYTIEGQPIKIDALYASEDSDASSRPRLTLTPLSLALGLPINTTYANKEVNDLAEELKERAVDKTTVICWHHGKMPKFLRALGADPDALLPNGKWPSKQFGWVIQLCYDKHGNLIPDLTICIKNP